MTLRRWALTGFVLGLLALMCVAGVRLNQVHDYGWEWTLFPSAAPPKVELEHRFYQRGVATDRVPAGAVASGETPGGGTIHAQFDSGTPVAIYVDDGEQVWGYGLMGGP